MNTTTKRALVTGANKGIGFETARQLAELGYETWLGCRDAQRGAAAADQLASAGSVRWVQLDVTDAESVRAAAQTLKAAGEALDVLVHNAGIYASEGDGAPSSVRLEAVHETFDTNVFGALRVTQAFLPQLRAAVAARVVMVSSGLGSLAWQSDPARGLSRWPTFAYSASKTALNALTVLLAAELRETPIRVNAVNPGFIGTDLNGHSGTGTPAEGAQRVVRAATAETSGVFFDADDGIVPW